ncbi:MAG: TadE/TadG family type IV pilus assembly protein, partial [Alphaproteobacteria bacterium]
MKSFKHLWSSFCRQTHGLGMVETALMMPMFLMFTFAVMDFGNYMVVKNRIVSANQTIATAIENNPTMTVSDLNVVIANSLGNLTIPWTGVAIWTSKT